MVTMTDIAEKAGVSRPTVSLVLNRREASVGISADTRTRVLEVAEQLGYRRNDLARAVVTGKNHMVGFLAVAPEVEHVSRMMVGCLSEAEERGHTFKVLRLHNNRVDRSVIDRCVNLRLAAVIVVHLHDADSLAYLHHELNRHQIPLAILDSSFPQAFGTRVISQDEVGAFNATEHLLQLGHRRIAFIAGREDSGSSALRQKGYLRALAAWSVPVREELLVRGQWDIEVTEQVTAQLLGLEAGKAPTAIFCASDIMALVAIRHAWMAGLNLPRDLSVVGYGNLSLTDLCYPALTTVAQPFHLMGQTAVRAVLEQTIEVPSGPPIEPREYALETRLAVRNSTAPTATEL